MGGVRLESTSKVYPNGFKAIDDVTLVGVFGPRV